MERPYDDVLGRGIKKKSVSQYFQISSNSNSWISNVGNILYSVMLSVFISLQFDFLLINESRTVIPGP